MIGIIKRLFCNHKYHLLSVYKKDLDKSQGYKVDNIHIIYCPKCKKETEVMAHIYKKIIERQKVDEEYERLK